MPGGGLLGAEGCCVGGMPTWNHSRKGDLPEVAEQHDEQHDCGDALLLRSIARCFADVLWMETRLWACFMDCGDACKRTEVVRGVLKEQQEMQNILDDIQMPEQMDQATREVLCSLRCGVRGLGKRVRFAEGIAESGVDLAGCGSRRGYRRCN